MTSNETLKIYRIILNNNLFDAFHTYIAFLA